MLKRFPTGRAAGWSNSVLLFAGFLLSAHDAAARPRPFVLVNETELSTLRQEVAEAGGKAKLYHAERGFSMMNGGRGARANADLWLKRKIEIPARGGHFHEFFCTEGDRLELSKDQRFVPGPYRCPKCGKEYRGEKYEGAMRRIVHGWPRPGGAGPRARLGAGAQNGIRGQGG